MLGHVCRDPRGTDGYKWLTEVQLRLELWEDAVRTAKRGLEVNEQNQEMQQLLQKAEAALKQSKEKNYYKILGTRCRHQHFEGGSGEWEHDPTSLPGYK